ncbi:LPD38 domain-containing protein [Maridesulfovibrio sp.]|uniref:LPD38 domain-containing protein n=1 Tax=Maridesulfovibrio sp. TaxID=2795000 RepID=UPI0029CA8ADB|nr:LPD38 domain-containing protein [Maridesulfovibrio sp.]
MDMNALFDQAVRELDYEQNTQNAPGSPDQGSPVFSSVGQTQTDTAVPVQQGFGMPLVDSAIDSAEGMYHGLAAGSAGLGESFGAGMQWLGNRLDSDSVAVAGEAIADYYKPLRESHAPAKELQGSVMDNPELLTRGDWWTYQVGNMAPSLGAAILPGAAVGKFVQVGGKALQLTPKVLERAARIGQALGAGLGGGALEGSSTYREVLDAGGTETEAARAGEFMALASSGLNAISFGKMFSKAGQGIASKTAKHLGSGLVEGLSEWAEEPAESISKDLAHYIETGEMKPGVWKRAKQAAREGVNVIGPAALTGVGGSVMSGPAGLSGEKDTSNQNFIEQIEQIKAGATVDLLEGDAEASERQDSMTSNRQDTGERTTPDTRSPLQRMSEFYSQQEKDFGPEPTGFGMQQVIDSQFESPSGMSDLKADIQERYHYKPEPELEERINREMAMREGWRPAEFDGAESLSISPEPQVPASFEPVDILLQEKPQIVSGQQDVSAENSAQYREGKFREASGLFGIATPEVVAHPDYDQTAAEAGRFNREWEQNLEQAWLKAVGELESEGKGSDPLIRVPEVEPSKQPVIEFPSYGIAGGLESVNTNLLQDSAVEPSQHHGVMTSSRQNEPQEDLFDVAIRELGHEKAFNRDPEGALFNLPDEQLKEVGKVLGVRQGKKSKIGFIESLPGGISEKREAYLSVVGGKVLVSGSETSKNQNAMPSSRQDGENYEEWHSRVLNKVNQIQDVATRDSYTRKVSPDFNPRMTADKKKWQKLEGWIDDILQKQNERDSQSELELIKNAIVDSVVSELSTGRKFKSITEARKFVEQDLEKNDVDHTITPGSESAKEFDEMFEVATVLAAKKLVLEMRKQGHSSLYIFKKLVDLYERQPVLGVRSSASIETNAYSTPAPIAYLASELAEISESRSVYEPTAGNGMLLLGADESNVVVNELTESRVENLRKFHRFESVHSEDASIFLPEGKFDAVVMNPPFGRLRENGKPKIWKINNQYRTKELDHAIALNALQAMKDDGKAVLIIGGKKGNAETRQKKYRAQMQRAFYATLFNEYNVVDHFTLDGKMYSRQGAAYPIDLIVIDGRGKSSRPQPASELPHVYESFEELETKFDELTDQSVHTENREVLRRSQGPEGQSGSADDNTGLDSGRKDGSGREGLLLDSSVSEGSVDAGARRESGGDSTGSGKNSTRKVRGYGVRAEREESEHSGLNTGRTERNPEVTDGREFRSDSKSGRVSVEGSAESSRRSGSTRGRSKRGGVGQDRSRIRSGAVETDFQVGYSPSSTGTSMEVLTPRNMAHATENALSILDSKYGNVDGFVAAELGYSVQELGKVLAAEQVDAVGLAISNLKERKGFIIGDQTGIGKGRVNAAIIRYARRKGAIPVFLTEKPNLYGDMIRDMDDIGESQEGIFITNTEKKDSVFKKGDGGLTEKHSPAKKQKMMLDIAAERTDKYDVVFTTYNQLQSLGKKKNHRQQFLRDIAPRAMFILDESHNAGGSSAAAAKGKVPRSKFIREILQDSPYGAFYSSATFAKRPDVMDLYFKTDMVKAVDDVSQLGEAISGGGVPMQQVVATMLTESGQYVRRERSFEGVAFDTKTVPASKELADAVGRVMQDIIVFDELKAEALTAIDKELSSAGENILPDGSVGEAGAGSTNFTSLMHNVIDQMLLCLKVDSTVELAKKHLERGEKPVIALANTMGSMVESYTKDHDIAPGQIIDIHFGDLLERYLERSREIVIGDPFGKKQKHRLSDSELGSIAVRHFNSIKKNIRKIDLSGLPMSPIDYIRQELVNAGYVVDEITGREHSIDYSDKNAPTYYKRKKPAPRTVIDGFNGGSIDAVIINCAGSTGLSLHASEKFQDQRPRRMLIAQAEKNIDTFMQTLGRIHRTGQVELPGFTLLNADIPAEKRPAAVLQKKMASLNASTTADSDSAVSSNETLDFMNEHGDKIVAELLSENLELHRKLGEPLKSFGIKDIIGGARKVTGRIPALPVKEQEEFYRVFESEYIEYMENLERSGVSSMKASHLDLDAVEINSKELTPGRPGASPFEGESKLVYMDVKKLGKPYSSDEVKEQIASAAGLEIDPDVSVLVRKVQKNFMEQLNLLKDEYDAYIRQTEEKIKNEDILERALDRAQSSYNKLISMLVSFKPGTIVALNGQDSSHTGVVLSVERKGKSDNPAALSRWKIRVALTDASRLYSGSLSRLATGSHETATDKMRMSLLDFPLKSFLTNFDKGQSDTREKRHIAVGNILGAYAALNNKGKIITFTDRDGRNQPGILLPDDFKVEEFDRNKPVSLGSSKSILAYLDEVGSKGIVRSFDSTLQIKKSGTNYELFTPKARGVGGRYYLNKGLLKALEAEFYSIGNRMRAIVDSEKLSKGIDSLIAEGVGFKVDSHKEEAKRIAEQLDRLPASLGGTNIEPVDRSTYEKPRRTERADLLQKGLEIQLRKNFPEGSIYEVDPIVDSAGREGVSGAGLEARGSTNDSASGLGGRRASERGQGRNGEKASGQSLSREAEEIQSGSADRQRAGAKASKRIPAGLPEQLSRIVAVFGKDITYVASDEKILHGDGYAPRWSDTIFFRPDANTPHLLILGHEILHNLRQDASPLYRKFFLAAQLQRKGNSWAEYHEDIDARVKAAGEKGMRPDQSYEELLADFSGEQFMDPEFWRALAKEEPTLFQRVSEKIKNILDRVLGVFKKGEAESPYFRDVKKVREALVEALSKYARQQNAEPSSRHDVKTSKRDDGIHFSKTSNPRNHTSTRSVRGAVQGLQAKAENALPLEVVSVFEDLPEHIRKAFKAQGGGYCEACNDPKTGKVWMVAENIASRRRAVELWMHEQGAHHGLRGLMGDKDYVALLGKVHRAAKREADYKEVVEDYGLDLSDQADRNTAAHEYLAKLAEKVRLDEVLSSKEKTIWRKVVDAFLNWLTRIRVKLPGSLTRAEISRLVSDAVFWTVQGESAAAPRAGEAAPSYSISNPDLKSAKSKIGPKGEIKTPIAERISKIREFMRTELNQGMFDRFASLKRLDKDAGIEDFQESAYVAARMSTSHADQIAAVIEHGHPVWREGAMDVEGEGLAKVFEPVAHELDRFTGWLVGLRARKLMEEGRENLFTKEEIDELCKLNQGRETKYEDVRQNYIQFKTKVLDFAEAAGVVSGSGRLVWEHDEYIPFYRINDETADVKAPKGKKAIASQYSGIKRLQGGTANLGDPFENIIRNFSHLIDASVKNNAMEQAMTNAEKIGVAVPADFKWQGVKLKGGSLRSALTKVLGKDGVAPLSAAQRDSLQTVFQMVKPDAKDVVHVLRDGKSVYYHVDDPLLLRSLTAVNLQSWNNMGMKAARFFKRLLTTGVTSTPDFMLRNLVRDTVHAWGVDRTGHFVPVVGSFKGAIKTLRKDKDTVKMMAAGAAFHGGYSYGHDPGAGKLVVEKLVKKHGIDEDSILDTPKKMAKFMKYGWDRWQDLGSSFENATRARLYEGVKEKGGTHLEAAYEAKDIMDYSMGGDWPVVRALCETVPFFGARMVGLHRLGRGAYENPQAFLAKGAIVALASVLLYMNNRDREEFKELEQWDRDNYYHFFINDKHFRMPKPFEIGAIFGTLPERLTEYAVDGQDGDLLANRLQFMLTQTFNVGTPQIITPVLEQWADKSFFTGRSIVPMRLKRLRPEAQRDHRTSETAALLGEKTGTSPQRIEHLVNGYFGTLGVYVLSMSDIITRRMVDAPEMPSRRLDDMPLIKSFYRDKPARHSRYLTELYEMVHEADELYSTVKAYAQSGYKDKAKVLLQDQENRKLLGKRQGLNQLRRAIGQIETGIRQIHLSRTLTPDQKRERIDGLLEKRNAVVRKVMG